MAKRKAKQPTEAHMEAALRVALARASLLEYMGDQRKTGNVDERLARALENLKAASALLVPSDSEEAGTAEP